MIGGRIIEHNLKPFAETVAFFAGYRFVECYRDAIFYGVIDTDEEVDRWYEYEFIGNSVVELRFARNAETDEVHVRI